MSKKSRYRPATLIEWARFVYAPDYTKNQRPRGVKRAGVTFEKRVQAALDKTLLGGVICNAWIEYYDSFTGLRSCSPDALHIDPVGGVITIIECKLSHTVNAYRQLEIYEKVICKLFPGFKVRGVEVCRNFVVGEDYPGGVNIVHDLAAEFSGIGNVRVWQI